ncbi:hypothetical protein Pan216_51830 [Planctomycetes bacterium Pan216]|uniref:DUF1552 domain-containing protein n=1 Tax=Kolteria novifilia TaxID=2527975 RepID=A0A518BBC4_9BACT|nr:hypothetical protein Pan216_51830 [Planctomycetes bacterium Pan216]
MNILTRQWQLKRRHFLRGAGAALALPMLDCMRPARAESTPEPERAKRSVFIYLPNGVNTLDYQILETGKDYSFSKSLKPLEKHRGVITPISGLHHPRAIGHHHNCQAVWLTGAQAGATARNSISVDQLIAAKTAPFTRFSSLEMSNTGRSLAYNADGIGLPAATKPAEIFKRLFVAPEGGVAKERRELERTGSVLDAVLGEARRLNKKIGGNDRTRLDQYLTSVREVEIRTQRANSWLDVPRPTIAKTDEARVNRTVDQQQVGNYFRTMYDLMVLAFQTDMTRVITFSSGDEGKGLPIPEIQINQTRHSLSHHNGDPEQLRRLTESDAFNFQQFAYLLERLQEIQEEDANLLDSTVLLYGSGMAYGHSHGNANVPTILAGGAKLGLKHGQHVDFNVGHFDGYTLDDANAHYQLCSRPLDSDARLSNLLLTVAQSMGVEADSFSDSIRTLSEVTS